MKLLPNLPGSLRFYFGLARNLCVLLAAFWLLVLTFAPWIQRQFVDEPKLMVTVGEVMLRGAPDTIAVDSNSAPSGSLALSTTRGTLQVDLISNDADLVSTLRWTVFPSVAVFIAFAWVVFGSLRNVCANIEKGELFSDTNLSLVRRIGLALIVYGVASILVGLWAAHVMNGYLDAHVSLSGFPSTINSPQGPGALRFLMPSGLMSTESSFVVGLLVLVVSEAFRRGLALKTENDLTV